MLLKPNKNKLILIYDFPEMILETFCVTGSTTIIQLLVNISPSYLFYIFTRLKLCIATATHILKSVTKYLQILVFKQS